jgi:hypothetical protein
MTTTAQHRARKPWWAALDDHSQGMWVRPHVCGLFSPNVGSFLNNLGWDRALFSRTVGTKARCSRAGRSMFSGNYPTFRIADLIFRNNTLHRVHPAA